MHTRLGLTIAICAMLCGCQGMPVHAVLPDAARDKVASTEVVLPIQQSEIYIFVPATTAGAGFGLVGALIDVSIDQVRSSKAETAIKPLRTAVSDYEFDTAFKASVQNALQQAPWLGAAPPRVLKEITDQNVDGAVTASKAAAVLFVAADYQLSNDGDELTVTATTRLVGTTPALQALVSKRDQKHPASPGNAIYRNRLVFKARIAAQPGGRDDNIAVWSARNGALLRTALDMASAKLAGMLVQDLLQTAAQDAAAAKQITKDPVAIGTDADGKTMRNADGTLTFMVNDTMKP